MVMAVRLVCLWALWCWLLSPAQLCRLSLIRYPRVALSHLGPLIIITVTKLPSTNDSFFIMPTRLQALFAYLKLLPLSWDPRWSQLLCLVAAIRHILSSWHLIMGRFLVLCIISLRTHRASAVAINICLPLSLLSYSAFCFLLANQWTVSCACDIAFLVFFTSKNNHQPSWLMIAFCHSIFCVSRVD